MAYGKDIFRTKYREANEGLKTAQNNYLELDHEYQMLAKRVEKTIDRLKEIQLNVIKYSANHDAVICQELIDMLDKENGDNNDILDKLKELKDK